MAEDAEEKVGELTGAAPVERVIVQEEAKLYRARVNLAFLDGAVYDFNACNVRFENNPVPVFNDDMKKIGFASGWVSGRRVGADVAIDYATEERLLAETGEVKLYPRIFGAMKFPAMPLFDFQQRLFPLSLKIHGIQLSRVAPADSRIVPFGEVVL